MISMSTTVVRGPSASPRVCQSRAAACSMQHVVTTRAGWYSRHTCSWDMDGGFNEFTIRRLEHTEVRASEMQQTVATRRQLAMLSRAHGKERRRRSEAGRTHLDQWSGGPTSIVRTITQHSCIYLIVSLVHVLSCCFQGSGYCRVETKLHTLLQPELLSEPSEGNQSEGTLGSAKTTLTPPPTRRHLPNPPSLSLALNLSPRKLGGLPPRG